MINNQIKQNILNSYKTQEETISKNIKMDLIVKGKKAVVGEVREWSGKKYKKQGNGKWVEISDKGKTRKEHEDLLVRFRESVDAQGVSDAMANRNMGIALEHEKHRDSLSNKEFDDEDLEDDSDNRRLEKIKSQVKGLREGGKLDDDGEERLNSLLKEFKEITGKELDSGFKNGDMVEVKSFTGSPTVGKIVRKLPHGTKYEVAFEGGGGGNYEPHEINKK